LFFKIGNREGESLCLGEAAELVEKDRIAAELVRN
jgi:hypothetical protein